MSLASLSPDLLVRICSLLSGYNDTLFSLATTCRALSAIALQTLWRAPDSYTPLFLTLPSSSTVRREREVVEAWRPEKWILHWPAHKYPARPSFSHSELERFYYYASLIQSLHLPEHSFRALCDFLVSSEMWTLLRNATSEPIFPNLHRVTIIVDWPLYVQDPLPIRPFLCPGVTYLFIGLDPYRTEVPDDVNLGSCAAVIELKDLLTNLPLNCPHLRELCIVVPPSPYFQDALMHVVQGLSNLTSFQSQGITLPPMGVAALSSLPNLTHVEISLRAADYTAHGMANIPPCIITFPALQELDVEADTAECVVTLLTWPVVNPSTSRLATLSVSATLTANDTSVQFLSLTTAISLMHCRCMLEKVILSTDISRISGANPWVDDLSPSTVAPLHDLPRLTCLRIDGYCHIAFDDAALAKMARAWPHLTILSVCEQNLQSEASGVTLVGLQHLALQCPALVELDIGVASIKRADCEQVLARPLHTGTGGDKCAPLGVCRLSTISVGSPGMDAEDLAAVAAALNTIFPYLARVQSGNGFGLTRDGWWGMRKAVDMLCMIRRQERKYASGRIGCRTS